MAIFNKSDKQHVAKNNNETTIITACSSIKGELNLDCSLFIDGEFEGTIHSSKLITVGKSGKVKGEINSKSLVVQGIIEGSIDAEHLEILAEGTVLGSILTQELIIEAKGHFEGDSKIKNRKTKLSAVDMLTQEKKTKT